MADWNPEAQFEAVTRRYLAEPGVETGTGFGGSPGVRVDGRIFAMLVRRRLVVKLPAARCQELREAGLGDSLAAGKRVMKEWIELNAQDPRLWRDLVAEAHAFVAGR